MDKDLLKTVWIDVRNWNKELVTTAIESGIDAVWVSPQDAEKVKELGLIPTVSELSESEYIIGENVLEVHIKGKEDEYFISNLSSDKIAIVTSDDWTIIPLENLIAQEKKMVIPVKTLEEAKTSLTVLEKGVWGVLIQTDDFSEIKKILNFAKNLIRTFALKEFTIKQIDKISMGDRVCIDTITNMKKGEGMLVGNYSNAFFLVHSETVENPYVNPRPFRVNAGAVHAYIMMPDGKTNYLEELSTGDNVLIVNSDGTSYISSIGRLKIEKRPMLNVIAEVDGKEVSVVLQNAETIRLTKPNGDYVSVVKLKKGDKVLGYTEQGGRHFGYQINETINEK